MNRSERGSALLELALALPVMLALVGAIVDGGWALHQAALVTAAAEAAQRAVAVLDTGSGDCAGAPPAAYADVSRAAAEAAAPTLDASRIVAMTVRYVEPSCAGRMRTLVVDMTYGLTALTPWFAPLLNGRSITAEAGSAVEEAPPPWWASAGQVQADHAVEAADASTIAAQQAQLAADQGRFAADQSTSASQQAQIASLASSYQNMASAYQAEASLAAALSQAVTYYYTLWQQLAAPAPSGGSDGHETEGGN
jgi:Flp pilus assembly protein TadG